MDTTTRVYTVPPPPRATSPWLQRLRWRKILAGVVLVGAGAITLALPYFATPGLHFVRLAALAFAGGAVVLVAALRRSRVWERGELIPVRLSEGLQVSDGISYFATFTFGGRKLVRRVLCPSGDKVAWVQHDGRIGPAVLVARATPKRPLLLTCELLDHSLSAHWLPADGSNRGAARAK
jgi:hypothetical protein